LSVVAEYYYSGLAAVQHLNHFVKQATPRLLATLDSFFLFSFFFFLFFLFFALFWRANQWISDTILKCREGSPSCRLLNMYSCSQLNRNTTFTVSNVKTNPFLHRIHRLLTSKSSITSHHIHIQQPRTAGDLLLELEHFERAGCAVRYRPN
jgi:hypothetical protein